MKKIYNLLGFTIISTLFVIVSCSKEDTDYNACNVLNPAEELAWLKTMINDLSDYDYIMTANYNGETVFYNGNCNPIVNYVSIVYNCFGEVIGQTYDIRDDLSDNKLVWKHEDSKCNFND